MSDHDWFRDNLALYGAGGLDADEALRFERHAAECAACAQELAQWRLFDQGLERLCAPAHFAANWDARVLARVHAAQNPPRKRLPALVKWSAAAAAVLFVGLLGAAVHAVAAMGFVAFPGGDRVVAEASMPVVLPVFATESDGDVTLPSGSYFGRSAARTESSNNLKQIGLGVHSANGDLAEWGRFKGPQDSGGDIKNANTIDFFPPAFALTVKPTDKIHTKISGGVIGGKEKSKDVDGEVAGRLDRAQKLSGLTPAGTQTPDLNVPIKGSSHEFGLGMGTMANYDRTGAKKPDVAAAGDYAPTGFGVRLDGKDMGVSVDGQLPTAGETTRDLGKRLAGLQQLQDGEMKAKLGDGSVKQLYDVRGYTSGSYTAVSEESARKATQDRLDEALTRHAELEKTLSGKVAGGDNGRGPSAKEELQQGLGRPPAEAPRTEKAPTRAVIIAGSEVTRDKTIRSGATAGGQFKLNLLKSSTEYHNLNVPGRAAPGAVAASKPAAGEEAKLMKATDEVIKNQTTLQQKTQELTDKEKAEPKPASPEPTEPAVNLPAPAQAQPKGQPDPQAAQRKIIRTGELEFEVDVFEDTVDQINKLIGAIPGAFVATKNSQKLENGKVKGAVVVRVPPENLDKFVRDLRQTLAKTGELKTERIGSADITKQYTDIESRLRAARTMEERMLAIIKGGKGDVKDLVAAEAQLGEWRTKIEQMEGEIRYYNNQVSLSTLTITAYEKEIRAAATMVITEQITMKIEADDVEKSLQTALAAVSEAKGRVTKSDLKQHAAGQLEAILQFEVAPANAGPVKDKLKVLGIVTHHDAQRLQQAEGGAAPKGEPMKSRTNDVRFNVTLYNVANIQPREAYVLQIVVPDVPVDYRKMLESVNAAKGQVRVSQLDEKDKFNIFAQLDFDVPTTQRDQFDKQLAALGDTVSKNTTRAGPGETATDRKVGYRLTLKSVTSVPPRETFTLVVYSLDVPAAYKKLQETAAQVKGNVRALQLNEQDKNNINAQFDVDIPKGDQATLDKLLDEMGDTASRTTSRVQPGEVATESKVGFRIALRSQVPPRETVALGIEVSDVTKSAGNLAELVKTAKGKVTAQQINQDASGRAAAFLLFDVPLASKDELVRKFAAIGKVRAQKATQNLQAPDGKLATAHIDVTLTNLSPIVPGDEGLYANVRNSLTYAFRLLSVSLMFVIVGISVLLPWALIVWIGVKLVRRMAKRPATA